MCIYAFGPAKPENKYSNTVYNCCKSLHSPNFTYQLLCVKGNLDLTHSLLLKYALSPKYFLQHRHGLLWLLYLFKHCCVFSYGKFKINSLKLTFRHYILIDLSVWQKSTYFMPFAIESLSFSVFNTFL